MKTLIAIPTCYATAYGDKKSADQSGILNRAGYLRTALKGNPDVRFFLGGGLLGQWLPERDGPQDVVLPVFDDYESLPQKVRAVFGWAYDEGYDFCLKLDDDSLFSLPAFLASDYAQYDYVGCALVGKTAGKEVAYASGAGYCLSRRAMEIAENFVVEDWAEDKEIGRVLSAAGIYVHHDERYKVCVCDVCKPNIGKDWILIHGGIGHVQES